MKDCGQHPTGPWQVHWGASRSLRRRGRPLPPRSLGCSHLAAAEADWTAHQETPDKIQNNYSKIEDGEERKKPNNDDQSKPTILRISTFHTSRKSSSVNVISCLLSWTASIPPSCVLLRIVSVMKGPDERRHRRRGRESLIGRRECDVFEEELMWSGSKDSREHMKSLLLGLFPILSFSSLSSLPIIILTAN